MAVFHNEPKTCQRLDWSLLQNGSITLYHSPEILAEDVEWLKVHRYRIDCFDCSGWDSEVMHEAFASGLTFPDYYGRNLAALEDCLSDVEIPEEGGRVLVFHRYDAFAAKVPGAAWDVLDIIEHNARRFLLIGLHLMALIQSDDPGITFEAVGCRPVLWNRREYLNKSRGL